MQGALLSAQELGVMVTFAGGDMDFEAAVLRIGNRRRDATMLVRPPKVAQILAPGEAALAELPGIGLERVMSLLDYCGSPATALEFLTTLDMGYAHCDGIGNVTKRNVRAALGLGEWTRLAIVGTDEKPQEDSNGH